MSAGISELQPHTGPIHHQASAFGKEMQRICVNKSVKKKHTRGKWESGLHDGV